MQISVKLRVGKRIQELRKQRGLTQEKFAEVTNIDYKYVQRIEGKNPPNLKLETLEKIAKTFKLPLSKLLDI